jgi:hypothetical protein
MNNGPGPSPALVFVGIQALALGAGTTFGDGLRCAGGVIQRLEVKILDANGNAGCRPGLAAANA